MSKRRRRGALLFAALAVLAAALFAAGCGGDDEGGNGDGGSASEGEPLKIEAVLALTGGFAAFDEPARAGIELAVEDVNAEGGAGGQHPIEINFSDGRSDPTQTVTRTQQALRKEPHVLIVPCQTDSAVPAGRLANEAKVPAISTCATSPTLTTAVGEYMFGNYPFDTLEALVAAQYAVDQGYKTAFLLSSPDSAYTANVPAAFEKVFADLGGEVVGTAEWTIGQQDFGPLIKRIKEAQPAPDVIETSMFEPDFPAFVRQLRAAGIDTPVLGAQGIDTPSVLSAGKFMDGVVYPTTAYEEPDNDLAEFNERLAEEYDPSFVTSYAQRGYDLITIISAAVEKADSLDPTAIRDALAGLVDVPGLANTTTYDYPGSNRLPVIDPFYVVRVDGGEKVLEREISVDPEDIPESGEPVEE